MPKHRRAFYAAFVPGLMFALLCVWPAAVGIQRVPFVANVVPFRGILALVLGGVAVVLVVVCVFRRRAGVAAGLAIALVAAGFGNVAVLGARGVGGSAEGGDITVAAWNTYGGGASPESIVRLVRETGADVVSLPETDAVAAVAAVDMLARDGIRMTSETVVAAPNEDPVPTSILIAESLGSYVRDTTVGSTPGLPSGVWRSADGRGPTLVAAHPLPPLPNVTGGWTDGLEWVAARCAEADVIVAGDLNSTLDHLIGLGRDGGVIGGCRDSAADAGSAALGTWPVRLPPTLAAPIDHVLASADWQTTAFRVLTDFDDAGSDHRPVVAELVRR